MGKYLVALAVLLIIVATLITSALIPGRNIQAADGDWSIFQGGNARTGYNSSENIITPSNVSSLQLKWIRKTGSSIVTQPIVVGGQVFFGSWDGNEYSTDFNGNLLWSASIGGQTPNCSPPMIFGASSTAAIENVSINGTPTEVVLVGGRDPTYNSAAFYALNAVTGAILWETPLSTSTGSYTWSSPAFYNGYIYVGLSSVDDCPLIQGALMQLDPATGTILNTFYTVPNGCIGASIWGSPAIDETTGIVYVVTGNGANGCPTKEVYGQAIIALNAADLSYISSWQIPLSQRINDPDFGATPTLFTATIGGTTVPMIGVENKSGIYYAFNRNVLSVGPVWQVTVGTGDKNLSSSAWDGTTLYVAGQMTTIGGQSCKGSLRALDPATGNFLWQTCLNDGNVYPAVMTISGVAFIGEGSHLVGIDTSSGQVLLNYNTTANIRGAASVSNGFVYVGNWTGNFYALGLPVVSTVTPSPGDTLAQDTFQRPNQVYWGVSTSGQLWAGSSNSQTMFSISHNTGQIASNGTKTYTTTLGPSATDAEVLFTVSVSTLGASNVGPVLRWSDSGDYYRADINGAELIILKKVGSVSTKLASVAFNAMPGVAYTMRFNIVGNTLSAKAWEADLAEPSNWMVMTTDMAFSSGYCGLLMSLQNGVTANVSSFQATAQ